MKFGETPLAEAEGAVLAHSVKLTDRTLKKGRVLIAEDIAALAASGKSAVVAARLEPGDLGENDAANAVTAVLGGPGITAAPAFTGRANLFAAAPGLCLVDRDGVDRFNLVDETITLATLEPDSVVAAREMVATVKIIPFAVQAEVLEACLTQIRRTATPLVQIASFRPRRVALIQTRLPGTKETMLDKTVATTRARLVALGSSLDWESRGAHETKALAPLLDAALKGGAELVLVAGASAIIDRRDVIPAAVTALGGTIDHFGMPVDPGNLLLMARIGGVEIMGLPGCARSPKVNGFDWVLRRVLAGLTVTAETIRRMGVGGLLGEIPTRPLPRAAAGTPAATTAAPASAGIAGLILAAGQSRRMGSINKLLIDIDGKPMLRHAVEAVLAAPVSPVVVVTGHEHDRVEAALQGLPVTFSHNPDFAGGLSTSLKAGLSAIPASAKGVLVALGDMPRVTTAEIERLIAAFNPLEGREIIVPTRRGKRGNPVLWATRFLPEMRQVDGDTGARQIIGANPEAVAEIEMAGDGVLTDIDTPQALAKLGRAARIDA